MMALTKTNWIRQTTAEKKAKKKKKKKERKKEKYINHQLDF